MEKTHITQLPYSPQEVQIPETVVKKETPGKKIILFGVLGFVSAFILVSTLGFSLKKTQPAQKVFCQEPRPQACTMECIQNPPYICGPDGKSYCSICQACSNPEVEWYVTQDKPCETE